MQSNWCLFSTQMPKQTYNWYSCLSLLRIWPIFWLLSYHGYKCADGHGSFCIYISPIVHCTTEFVDWDDYGPGIYNICNNFWGQSNYSLEICSSVQIVINLTFEEQRALYTKLGQIIMDKQFGESWIQETGILNSTCLLILFVNRFSSFLYTLLSYLPAGIQPISHCIAFSPLMNMMFKECIARLFVSTISIAISLQLFLHSGLKKVHC